MDDAVAADSAAGDLIRDETARAEQLIAAQGMAERLFAEVMERQIIRPGRGERETSDAIRDLAAAEFGTQRWWHKRIVRGGPNTLTIYRENPPDRPIAEDDIVFLDFGPVFAQWEADFGRTFVIGTDPVKHALCTALDEVWVAAQRHFADRPDITGSQLYDHTCALARDAGWEFGGVIAGHLVGQFPYERAGLDDVETRIAPGCDLPLRRTDARGIHCHWILEVHLIDRARGFGGFVEELLDIGPRT
jgi:Xaa-Pro aminopeptidase